MVNPARSLGSRLLGAAAGCLLAVGLALAARHLYRAPNLLGSTSKSPWLEGDFLCSLASTACALAVGFWAQDRRLAIRRPFSGLALRALIWFALTLVLFAVWAHSVSLFTLAIAPSHAFAALRVVTLWRGWHSDRVWRRAR